METKWISVDDRLPENDCIVDVWMPEYNDPYKRVADVYFNSIQKTFYIDYNFLDVTNDITHWMPLPNPPKQESK